MDPSRPAFAVCRGPPELAAGSVMVAVAADGCQAGHLVMSDPLREGAAGMLAGLLGQGVARILPDPGERAGVAARVTDAADPSQNGWMKFKRWRAVATACLCAS